MGDDIVFIVKNRHNAGIGLLPVEAREGDEMYRAYFENQHGEQLIFVYDRGTEHAVLYHGDMDWEPRTVTEQGGVIVADTILNDFERQWLSICWKTATALARFR